MHVSRAKPIGMVAQAHIVLGHYSEAIWRGSPGTNSNRLLGGRSACLVGCFVLSHPVLYDVHPYVWIYACLPMLVFLHSGACIYWLVLSSYRLSCFVGGVIHTCGYFMYAVVA